MAKVELQPAYVIHTRQYRETSLLVEVFTPEYGLKTVVARGARAPKSRYRALLQAHRPLLVSWSGRGEMGTLIGAESAGIAIALRGNCLWSALYMNELIERLCTRHEPQLELFVLYEQSLGALAKVVESQDMERSLRWFEKRLLDLLGYGLCLDRSVDDQQAIVADQDYFYVMNSGPMSHPHDDALPISGACLLALKAGRLENALLLKGAKRLMRWVLAQYLGNRPLKSRELFGRR